MRTPHKHAEIIKAWADGAEIQLWSNSTWADIELPAWGTDVSYRIKPTKKKPEEVLYNMLKNAFGLSMKWEDLPGLIQERYRNIVNKFLKAYKEGEFECDS